MSLALLVTCSALTGGAGADRTPEATLRSLVAAMNAKDVSAIARHVEGGQATAAMQREISSQAWPKISVSNVKITVSGGRAAGFAHVSMVSGPHVSIATDDAFQMRLVGRDWKLVPQPMTKDHSFFGPIAYRLSTQERARGR